MSKQAKQAIDGATRGGGGGPVGMLMKLAVGAGAAGYLGYNGLFNGERPHGGGGAATASEAGAKPGEHACAGAGAGPRCRPPDAPTAPLTRRSRGWPPCGHVQPRRRRQGLGVHRGNALQDSLRRARGHLRRPHPAPLRQLPHRLPRCASARARPAPRAPADARPARQTCKWSTLTCVCCRGPTLSSCPPSTASSASVRGARRRGGAARP